MKFTVTSNSLRRIFSKGIIHQGILRPEVQIHFGDLIHQKIQYWFQILIKYIPIRLFRSVTSQKCDAFSRLELIVVFHANQLMSVQKMYFSFPYIPRGTFSSVVHE